MRPSSRRVIFFFLALAFILTAAIAPLRAHLRRADQRVAAILSVSR